MSQSQDQHQAKSQSLHNLFRRFSTYKLNIKEMKAKAAKSKKASQDLTPKLEELERDAQRLQELKNRYSFGESKDAKNLAEIFASALEELEAKFTKVKNGLGA